MLLQDLAARLGVPLDALIPYGRDIAKLDGEPGPPRGRLVLVSAITPTGHGEGKTTVAIGLADGLRAIGEHAVVALRQPSLGPLLGTKGGGSGGGRASLVPAQRIDLHFTGDLHAIAAAHNLLAAAIDNHLHFGTELGLDARSITWPRAIDMNDRALRRVLVGIGDLERETGFVATAASELTAVLGLARDRAELRARLDRIVIGRTRAGAPVTAADVGVAATMQRLLAEAAIPNLAATAEGTPAFVHGGPFANIAHGCSSVVATRAALGLADWVVTEAGFGFDLGGEKFFDIKCRSAGLDAAAVVLVMSVPSVIAHGRGDLRAGMANVAAHVEAVRRLGKSPVLAVNTHAGDPGDAFAVIAEHAETWSVPVVATDAYVRGGAGAEALARAVIAAASDAPVRYPYELSDPPRAKLLAIATQIYGARDVVWTTTAERELEATVALGGATWPVCVAKTQWSLSDESTHVGRPADFVLTVRGVSPAAGAGFWVARCGDINLMPGLGRHPRAFDP